MSKSKRTRAQYLAEIRKASIDRYYELYKDIINKGYFYTKSPYKAFITEVDHTMKKQKLSVKGAVTKTLRSEIFVPEELRLKRNLMKGLREQSKSEIKKAKANGKDIPETAYDKFRKYTRHQKFDYDKLTYIGFDESGTMETYEYEIKPGRKIIFEIDQSPHGIDVVKTW